MTGPTALGLGVTRGASPLGIVVPGETIVAAAVPPTGEFPFATAAAAAAAAAVASAAAATAAALAFLFPLGSFYGPGVSMSVPAPVLERAFADGIATVWLPASPEGLRFCVGVEVPAAFSPFTVAV